MSESPTPRPRRRGSVPFVPQMEAVECGAASLTMSLRYWGFHAQLGELRDACGVSRDGVDARTLVRVARQFKLKTRARRLEPQDLEGVGCPAILHWEMNHFVVFERWTKDAVFIVDPALGPRRISTEEFDKAFSGVCIELEPGEGFAPRKARAVSLDRYLTTLKGAGGALGMLVLASIMLNLLGLATPIALTLVVDQVLVHQQTHWLETIGHSVLALIVLTLLVSLMRVNVVAAIRRHIDAAVGLSFIRHLLSLPAQFFAQRSTSDLVHRVRGTSIVRELLAGQVITLLVDSVLLVSYLALAIAYEWRLGLAVLGGGLLYTIIFLVARPHRMLAYRERMALDIKEDVPLYQTVLGILTVKSSGREETAYQQWRKPLVEAMNAAIHESRLSDRVDAALFLVRVALPALVLTWGAHFVVRGEITLGTLLGIGLLEGAILGPLGRVIATLLHVGVLPVHLDRMDDVLEAKPEPSGTRTCPRLEGEVRFEDVTFSYGPNAPPVLRGLSLTAAKGEKIALVGPSGSGKSTVARLLLGLYRPSSGRVLVDGHELGELELSSVRRQIGTVLQETALFAGTVRENISLYHRGAPLEDVEQAARVAQLHDDIEAMPQGYRTRISGSSSPLSGGQRQRLALARAVLTRPQILILDEATSALDAVTEAAVERYLSSRKCTRIVIAHRLSTVRDADRIYVLDKGQVVEEGRHEELLAAGGLYADLAKSGEQAPTPASVERSEGKVGAADLERFAPFAALSLEEREALAARLVRRVVAQGDSLIEQDERGAGLFLVEQGELDVVVHEPGLAPLTVGRVSEGDVVGEVGLLDGSPTSASVVATTAARLLHLPVQEFESLRRLQDRLAARVIIALGGLMAARLRRSTAKLQELGRPGIPPQKKAPARRGRELRVEETALGASLTRPELDRLDQLGHLVRFDEGETLFEQGDPAHTSYLLLKGRVGVTVPGVDGYLNTMDPGELFGGVAFFDDDTRTARCVAVEPTTLFAIDHAVLRELVLGGNSAAWKVMRHLSHGLAHVLRISNLRLREWIALENDELDGAHRAREEALALARSDDQSLTALAQDKSGAVPLVRARDAESSGTACATALLRYHGRAVPLGTVEEACGDGGQVSERSITVGLRSFGMLVRPLKVRASELSYLEAPLLCALSDGGWVVAEHYRGGVLTVMDPTGKRRELDHAEAAAALQGICLEVLPEEGASHTLTFAERLGKALAGRAGMAWSLVVTTVLLQLATLVLPVLTSLVIGTALPAGDVQLLTVIAAAAAVAVVAESWVMFARRRALVVLRTAASGTLLDQLFRHVLSLPISFFEKHPPAVVVERFGAFRMLRDVFDNEALGVLLDLPMLVLSFAFMALLDGQLFGLVTGVALLMVLLVAVTSPRLAALEAEQQQKAVESGDRLIEVLGGVITLRAAGDDEAGIGHFSPSFLRGIEVSVRKETLQSMQAATLTALVLGALGAATWWGAARVLDEQLSLGALMAFTAVATSFLFSLHYALAQATAFSQARVALRKVEGTFLEPREQGLEAVAPPGRLRGGIRLDRVTFGYDKDGPPVIQDVSIEIVPGSKVALVGGSGSGKSTLGKLLMGFYQPDRGRILYDQKPLYGLDLPAVRRQLGVVLQDSFLFAGSVRQNLSLCAPGASLEPIIDAAKRAAIHDAIAAMPMQYETVVPQGGSSFSGGQRQRLSLARALVHQPAVLLLDEATSALDNVSQRAVEQNLAELPCTRIVIAHRLSTVIDADQIIVLHKGRVVETGRHAELLAKKGAYAELVAAQLG